MSLESSPSFSSLVAEASSLSKSSLRELLASADRNQNLVAHVASKESEVCYMFYACTFYVLTFFDV